jgi:hypothetical protein
MSGHKWIRELDTVAVFRDPKLRSVLFRCEKCEQCLAHFYNICANMAHAMEIEQVSPTCDVFEFPGAVTMRQLCVERDFQAHQAKHGPVYESAIQFFRAHKEQPPRTCRRRCKGQ